jgi:acetyltransferase
LNRYRRWLERPAPAVRPLAVQQAQATHIIEQALSAGRTRLKSLEALELVRAYGIPVVPTTIATSANQAVDQSQSKYPVVLKIAAEDVIHKTDIGGVALGLSDEADVRAAFARLMEVAERTGSAEAVRAGALVQQQITGGVEMIAGLSRDAVFGPLIMFGLGGIFVEALHDVIFRLAPIDALEAAEMVRGTRSAHVLKGVRGQPPADQDALIDALCRLSQLAVDLPQVAELDLNPLLARPSGVLALDARVTLRPA